MNFDYYLRKRFGFRWQKLKRIFQKIAFLPARLAFQVFLLIICMLGFPQFIVNMNEASKGVKL